MSLARLIRERNEQRSEDGTQGGKGTNTGTAFIGAAMSFSLSRIRADLDSLKGISSKVTASPSDPFVVGVIVQPVRGIWEGGTFHFVLKFSDDYPYEGPKVRYTGPNRIFHPNIEGEADKEDWGVCLGLQLEWRPSYSIRDLVIGIELLFSYPVCDDPLPGVAKAAALMLKNHPCEFRKVARCWMRGEYCQNEGDLLQNANADEEY
ncbi:unnamed protein product [Phytomonas sp. EM1]|nr:unnamed protein product [Phytomonas sp. EM1]|eukprot:CCW62605.1 unnamed protein product [Phytomonas sp. isolate EM1]